MISASILNRKLLQLDEAIDESLRRRLLFVRGPFQSGKTWLLHQLLELRGLPVSEHYLALNQYLINRLQTELTPRRDLNYTLLSRLKGKTAALFSDYIGQYLAVFFQTKNFLVIDSIELLYNYPVNLPQIASSYCGDRNCIIIAVPLDEKYNFKFKWNYQLAKIIDLNADF